MESYKRLYKRLRESEFECVPPGFQDTTDVYEIVSREYPELCDDDIACSEVCGTTKDQPEWKHRIRTVQQDLVRESDSRIKRLSNGWYYEPTKIEIKHVSKDNPSFEVGANYNRWELHDLFGGQRYRGITPTPDQPMVFIFTGDSGEDYGYEDEFVDDGAFLYTGEGAEGDMEMDAFNRAILEHGEENNDLHLFEDTEYPWIVTYLGQFEYVSHRWEKLEDQQNEQREAIRFRLEPVGGTKIKIEKGTPSSLSDSELFEKAKQSSPTRSKPNSSEDSTSKGRTYPRSAIVKEFALRHADGVCQGCGESAPFVDDSGEPFLEVHHLHRRSDGGPDDPENVVALCPNCHRRVHHGKDGDEFNRDLIQSAEKRNMELS